MTCTTVHSPRIVYVDVYGGIVADWGKGRLGTGSLFLTHPMRF